MKHLWFVLVALMTFAGVAHAQMSSGSSGASSAPDAKASLHNFSVLISMARGGAALGAAYEYMYEGSTGIGAHIRTFAKETSGDVIEQGPGLMIVGAQLGHHFFKKRWDLAFTPSFNLISIDSHVSGPNNPEDATTFGPGMSISLLWQITDRISAGFDYNNYWVWLDSDWAGHRISDMAFKLRVGF